MSTAQLAASGFVRMPRAWVSLEISPGAKALLLHLCAAANDAGESWYKYSKLGAIIGRSKAAVSGYVSELVEAGIIETERQRTANGYHAHLLIRLIGWSELTRAWSEMSRARRSKPPAPAPTLAAAAPAASAERRVRPAERLSPSGTNKSHSTDSAAGAAAEWSEEDEAEWRRVKPGEQGLDFDRPPEDALLRRVVAAHDALKAQAGVVERPALEAAARRALEGFRDRRALSADVGTLGDCATALAGQARTLAGVERAVAHLDAVWAPHWRRLSTPAQLSALLSGAEARQAILSEQDRRLWRFAGRALMARRELEARRRLRERLARRPAPA